MPVDAGLVEDLVEHLAGRPDERLAGNILLVAGLLADEDDLRILRPFAEHGLRGVAPERAAAAALGRPRAVRRWNWRSLQPDRS